MSDRTDAPVMIVGAGPTGLAAALFLSRRGIPVRIIDAAACASTTSKALLVNPRSLEMLGESGVAARVRKEGQPMLGATLHRGGREVAGLDVADHGAGELPIALAQARTEAMLTDALQARGVSVERCLRLVSLKQDAARVTMQLRHDDGRTQRVDAPLVFGADGAHSAVRESLGIDFAGSSLPEPWLLWDLRLATSLDPARVHIALVPDGFLFVMRVACDVWRVIGNGADPLAQLPGASTPGEVIWQSHFHIAHRLAGRLAVGRVALGGDAAHIHSPLGARGMNLGIEDAWVFAACAADALAGKPQRMDDYARLRTPVDHAVVRRVAAITRLMRGRPAPLRWLRDALAPRVITLGPVRRRILRTIRGEDHPLRLE